MTNKTVLSDEARAAVLTKWRDIDYSSTTVAILGLVEMVEQAVLQSPEIRQALADSKRIDWLADPNNHIGSVQLPIEVVESNLHSLRDAIDAAMEQKP